MIRADSSLVHSFVRGGAYEFAKVAAWRHCRSSRLTPIYSGLTSLLNQFASEPPREQITLSNPPLTVLSRHGKMLSVKRKHCESPEDCVGSTPKRKRLNDLAVKRKAGEEDPRGPSKKARVDTTEGVETTPAVKVVKARRRRVRCEDDDDLRSAMVLVLMNRKNDRPLRQTLQVPPVAVPLSDKSRTAAIRRKAMETTFHYTRPWESRWCLPDELKQFPC